MFAIAGVFMVTPFNEDGHNVQLKSTINSRRQKRENLEEWNRHGFLEQRESVRYC